MTGMFAGNDIYYPYASDGAVNIDGLLRRLEKDGYTGFCTMEPHTTPEKCLDFYREETAYLRERGIKRINDIYGEDDSGHFRRIFMNGQVNCHIFTGKFCITVDF